MTDWYSTSAKGAASELLACVYFLKAGCHVFRSESPSCPFDLVIHRAGLLSRVEIKSLVWRSVEPARYVHAAGPVVSWPANDDWDILVVVNLDTGDCLEVTTHDKEEGRAQVREWCGFPPLVKSTIRSRIDPDLSRLFESSPDLVFSYADLVKTSGYKSHQCRASVDRLVNKEIIIVESKGNFRWNSCVE